MTPKGGRLVIILVYYGEVSSQKLDNLIFLSSERCSLTWRENNSNIHSINVDGNNYHN